MLKFPENLEYPFQTEDLLKYHELTKDNFSNNNNILQTQYINTLNEIDNATNFELYSEKYQNATLKQKQLVFRAFAMIWNFNVTYQQNFFSTGTGFNITQGNITQAQTYNSQRPQLFSMAFHLLKQAGFYNELNLINTTKTVGEQESNGNLTATYVVGDQNEYLRWNQARKYWVRGENFISSDKSVKIKFDNSTWKGVLDLSASTVSPEHDFGNSLKKINNKFEVVKLKNEIGDQNLTYDSLNESINEIEQKIKTLKQKIEHLPHPAVLGDSLKKINDKFEVVKLKNKTGNHSLTYDKWFDKYNQILKSLKSLTEEISTIEAKLKIYNQWFNFNSVKFLTTAFKNNTANYFLHTDGEFSFHYWQNPSLITTYKKPEDYVFTQLFGINQNPPITDWSPYIEYDFNANTGEVDFRFASFKKTGAGWDKKLYLIIKNEEGDTTFDFKKNPLTFKFKDKTYDVQNLLDKIHDRPSHKEVLFNQEVLNITRKVAVTDKNNNIIRDKNGKILKKQNPNIVESGNTVEIHGYSELIRNTKFVGKTLQFEFVRCEGDEDKLHGDEYKYTVYSVIFEADKLPALNTSTWTKIYKMDSRVQWFLGNRGEIKTEHWDDCVKGTPTIQLKLEESGYYLKFTWNGFTRWWTGTAINFSTKSYWTNFKIIADVYK